MRSLGHRLDLSAAVAAALTHAGLRHGPLVEVTGWGNLSFTDHASLFVKTNRPSDPHTIGGLVGELRAASWAAGLGVDAVLPLLGDPLDLWGDGSWVATVWPYQHPATGGVDGTATLGVLGRAAQAIGGAGRPPSAG